MLSSSSSSEDGGVKGLTSALKQVARWTLQNWAVVGREW